jgi:hypothetical protein
MSATTTRPGNVAQIDFLVDEAGNAVEAKDPTSDFEEAIETAGPTNWWLIGLSALFVVAAILLTVQFLSGNTGTAVYRNSPVAAPQTENPAVAPTSAQ